MPKPPHRGGCDIASMVRVWDLPVRLVHAGLVASVGLAVWSGGHPSRVAWHVFAGNLLVFLLAFRLLWGFVGTRWARWRAFLFSPREVAEHLRGLVRGRPERHSGHNPVASWAMLVGLVLLVAIVLTGELTYAGAEQQGPFAGRLSVSQGLAIGRLHEILTWVLYAWIAVHLLGVLKESLLFGEWLAFAIVSGRKIVAHPSHAVPARAGVALGIVFAGVLGSSRFFLGWWAASTEHPWFPYTPVAMADDGTWRAACEECHLPFHPALLPARSWARMMDEQAAHFGEDLALDEATAASVRTFLVANAAEREATEWAARIAAAVPEDEAPQRITELPWWEERHAIVPEADWDLAESPLRCAACHLDAEEGSFEDGAMRRPLPPGNLTRR